MNATATAERIDTSRIKLPGHTGAPMVSGAPTEMLREEITSCVDEIRRLLEPKGLELTKDERLPVGYLTRFTRGDTANLNAVEREVKRLHAVRQELADRAVDQKRKATAELKAAREGLDQAVSEGIAHLDALGAYAAKVAPAQDRMRQFVADVHAVVGASQLAQDVQQTHSAIRTAAAALGKPAPKLPEVPQGTPTRNEIDALIYVIRGLVKGAGVALPEGADVAEMPRVPASISYADSNARKLT